MAFDLGDTIPLQWQTADASGAAANVGVAVLTITMPDNSTLTPALTNTGTGAYSPTTPFVATQAGRHEVRWVGTGANPQAFVDVFAVLAADPGLIISLAQARKSLRLPVGAPVTLTPDDEDLRDLIAAARGPMEDICGAILARPYDEWHDGGTSILRLMDAPMIEIASVVECHGAGYRRPLTQQVLDSGSSFDAYGYSADLRDGTLQRRVAGGTGCFLAGQRNIHVTGTAGRAVVSPHIVRATRRLVRWLWQSEMQGGRPAGTAPEAMTYTASGHAVPNAVIELCADERRVVTVG